MPCSINYTAKQTFFKVSIFCRPSLSVEAALSVPSESLKTVPVQRGFIAMAVLFCPSPTALARRKPKAFPSPMRTVLKVRA